MRNRPLRPLDPITKGSAPFRFLERTGFDDVYGPFKRKTQFAPGFFHQREPHQKNDSKTPVVVFSATAPACRLL
jgi:hypothetical protein